MGQESRRSGPRPLPLHLLTEAATLMTSGAGLALLRSGSPFWRPSLRQRAAELAAEAAGVAPEALAAAVEAEARRRFDGFLGGVEGYRRHPYRRGLDEPPTVWRAGTTRLLDFGRDPAAPPVLVVPSLINRYYVLDLTPRRSLARYLAGKGLRPLVVDWGAPGPDEAAFGVADYVARLEAMLDVAGRRAAVLGYCMGGLLALALAARRPDRVAALALLATPWDFHAPDPGPARALAAAEPVLGPALDAAGGMPVDGLQAMFAAVDPRLVGGKFRRLAALRPRSAAARDFVALEDWANDGVPLVAPVARECLFDWYGRNGPAAGEWRLGGAVVRPQELRMPAMAMVPLRDRIVPPDSALALAAAVPRCRIRRVDAGHVGMIIGRMAKTKVYHPLSKWMNAAMQQVLAGG